MILPFSQLMPWVDADGNVIPTNFMEKTKTGIKKHTFRTDTRWRKDLKIHPYQNNPRNGGTPFNFQIQHASRWHWVESGEIIKRESITWWPLNFTPQHELAVPVVDGVEHFRFDIQEMGENGTLIQLTIEGKLVVSCNFNLLTRTTKHYFKTSRPMLEQIAENDGLSEFNFLRWFQLLARRHEVKVLEGKVVHWTSHRYVAPMETHDPFVDGALEDKKNKSWG